jgi:predicted Zn-dependent protease
MARKLPAKFLCSVLCLAGALSAADSAMMRAMKDELDRSIKKLRLENLDKPYFVAYRSVETSFCTVGASFGALTTSSCRVPASPNRNLSIEVRVGDYSRDNTNFYAPLAVAGVIRTLNAGGVTTPIDDNYDEIRRQLWLATDSAYKNALDMFAKKKAALENRTRTDDAPDLSKEPVFTFEDTGRPIDWNPSAIEAMVKDYSRLFREAPGIDFSEVRLVGNSWLTTYVNSEGSSFTRRLNFVTVTVGVEAQANDGMPLTDFEVFNARSVRDLPSREEITKRIRAMEARVAAMKKAPLLDRYNGPVMFEGQASAEILLQGIGGALVGTPRVVVDDLRFERLYTSNAGLSDKIGNRVFPSFISVSDIPSAMELQGQPLFGGYPVDDDGVKAGGTQLIDGGILKTLLRSRALLAGTTQSSASRRGMGPMPSNLIFTAAKGMSEAELKAELLKIVKQRNLEFGVVVRRMGNPMITITQARSRIIIMTSGGPGGIQVEPLIEAYKIYPDGREELVRNLNIEGLQFGAFKDIVAAGSVPYVYTAPFRNIIRSPMMAQMFTFPGGPNVVSLAAPSLLFEDMALRRPTGEIPNLPFTKHPFFEGK